jgi:hypothetical protein
MPSGLQNKIATSPTTNNNPKLTERRDGKSTSSPCCKYCGHTFATVKEKNHHSKLCDAYDSAPLNPRGWGVDEEETHTRLRSRRSENVQRELDIAREAKDSDDEKIDPTLHPKLHKPYDDVGPEQHHSARLPSKGANVSSDLNYQRHTQQLPLSDSFTIDRKERLDLPKPSDKIWKEIDQELGDALYCVLPDRDILRRPPAETLAKLEKYVYNFLRDKFPQEAKPMKNPRKLFTLARKRHRNQLEVLRKKKAENKRAMKALVKCGLGVSDSAALLRKERKDLLRKHSKLRNKILGAQQAKLRAWEERLFRQNPMKYTKKAFATQQMKGNPTFGKEAAQEFFARTYSDEERDHQFEPIDGLERPPPPNTPYKSLSLDFGQLLKVVKRKRNGATPGFNGINYVVWKKCISALKKLFLIFQQVLKTGDTPEQWAVAFIVLLAKYADTSEPSLFRPIALTTCDGKLFFSLIALALETFAIENNYIQRKIQKGFLTGVPGCIEHTFTFNEALEDATKHQRQFIAVWIDLANAYGSVMHNLIQFALWWYHVPADVAAIIFDYYEKLCAQVVTKEWSTGFFRYSIGLFQGCVLSTILFDLVFNLMLDFLAKHDDKGYTFKSATNGKGELLRMLRKAYADDLAFLLRNPEAARIVLLDMAKWLSWTKTMKAKPPKCRCWGFKKFNKSLREAWNPHSQNTYTTFDPKLTINGQPVVAIGPSGVAPDGEDLFKFLGRIFRHNLTDVPDREKLQSRFEHDMDLVDKLLVNGLHKTWIYQHFVVPCVCSWSFMIYDFPESVAIAIRKSAIRTLKKWTHLFKSADVGVLFRPFSQFGLQLTDPVVHFRKMQTAKLHMLKHSKDPIVQDTYSHRLIRHRSMAKSDGRVWKPTIAVEQAEIQVEFEQKFQVGPDDIYHNRQGLGTLQSSKATLSNSEHRKRVTGVISRDAAHESFTHSVGLAMQGGWTKWGEHCRPLRLSWRLLLASHSPRFIAHLLNSYINSVPTPDMLKMWGYRAHATCKLCGHKLASLIHIISGCTTALHQGRFTWRHDSVLNTLLEPLRDHIRKMNTKARKPASGQIAFVKSGAKQAKQPKKQPFERDHLLSTASDWKILVDFTHIPIVFPPIICPTLQRPDIVIWSTNTKTVIWAELTCPAEENITDAQTRKTVRYAPLKQQCLAANWTVHDFTIEAGARGCVANTFRTFLRKIGISSEQTNRLLRDVAFTTSRCTFAIFCGSHHRKWSRHELLGGSDHKAEC